MPDCGRSKRNETVPLPRVEGDNRRIGQLAAEHFLERGYRHYAWAPYLNDVMNVERFEGFSGTLAKHGLDCRVLPLAHSLLRVPLSSVRHDLEGMAYEAAALLERLMSGRKPPRGVVRIPPKGVVTRVSTDMRAVSDLHVAIALRCLPDRFRDPQLSVADVVSAAGVSRRQLERSFRRETGSTIHGHLTRARVTHAAQLLAEGELKVAAIAAAAGFSGPAHLHRAFRRSLGTTPRRFRARQRSASASP